jgi:hypothetical protein
VTGAEKTIVLVALVGVGGVGAYLLYKRFAEGNVDVSQVAQAPSDFIGKLAQAITIAEGSPAEWNNPGDLTQGDASGYDLQRDGNGNLLVNSAGVVRFVNQADGVNALYRKLQRIQAGASRVYSTAMSIAQFAQIYTGGDNADSWANNVASFLGLDPNGNSVGDALGV